MRDRTRNRKLRKTSKSKKGKTTNKSRNKNKTRKGGMFRSFGRRNPNDEFNHALDKLKGIHREYMYQIYSSDYQPRVAMNCFIEFIFECRKFEGLCMKIYESIPEANLNDTPHNLLSFEIHLYSTLKQVISKPKEYLHFHNSAKDYEQKIIKNYINAFIKGNINNIGLLTLYLKGLRHVIEEEPSIQELIDSVEANVNSSAIRKNIELVNEIDKLKRELEKLKESTQSENVRQNLELPVSQRNIEL
jgi:hypothetical protein